MTNTNNLIAMPQTIEAYKDSLKKAIEFYSASPVKNNNKLNESLAKSLDFKNYDTLSALLKNNSLKAPLKISSNSYLNIKYDISISDDNETSINGILINEKLFDEEIVRYNVRTREEIVDFIISSISEANIYNANLMKEDLRFLFSIEDEFVFNSIETNKYIAYSQDPKEFNEIAESIIVEHFILENDCREFIQFLNDDCREFIQFLNDDWRGFIQFLNDNILNNISSSCLDFNEYYLDDVLSNLEDILNKTSINDFYRFLINNQERTLFQKIKKDENLHHEVVLLIWFLNSEFKEDLHEIWDFDEKLLNDLGI